MAREPSTTDDYADVDQTLRSWQQGDCALGVSGFIYRYQAGRPASPESSSLDDGSDVVEVSTPGLVVVTQTCDIQRAVKLRPYVKVASLVTVWSDADMDDIKSRRRPRFAHVPGVAAKNLVADLDQIMTIEKPLLAAWPRDVGCRSDAELRDFADALSRKFSRFAFPNDFVLIVKNLTERIKVKHGRAESDEGRAFRALREIRVGASPHWNDSRVDLMFYFIRHEEQTRFGDKGWDHWRQKWLNLITVSSRYASVDGIVLPLSQLRADEYLASDRLDFDHLTAGGG